jgi:hypothetical protein
MARLSFNLKLCDEYKRTPPPETWDGVIALDRNSSNPFVYTLRSKSLHPRNRKFTAV